MADHAKTKVLSAEGNNVPKYRVQLKGADKLWARVPHTKKKKVHINMCLETFNCEL
jgi:hypothetical protein